MDETTVPEGTTEESGSTLRQKYEQTLAEYTSAVEANHGLVAEVAILRGGHDLVKPEDLKGVSIDELQTKAAELQAQRVKERDEFFAAEAARRGIKLSGEQDTTPGSLSRIASLGSLTGIAPGAVKKDPREMSTDELLTDAFSKK